MRIYVYAGCDAEKGAQRKSRITMQWSAPQFFLCQVGDSVEVMAKGFDVGLSVGMKTSRRELICIYGAPARPNFSLAWPNLVSLSLAVCTKPRCEHTLLIVSFFS